MFFENWLLFTSSSCEILKVTTQEIQNKRAAYPPPSTMSDKWGNIACKWTEHAAVINNHKRNTWRRWGTVYISDGVLRTSNATRNIYIIQKSKQYWFFGTGTRYSMWFSLMISETLWHYDWRLDRDSGWFFVTAAEVAAFDTATSPPRVRPIALRYLPFSTHTIIWNKADMPKSVRTAATCLTGHSI